MSLELTYNRESIFHWFFPTLITFPFFLICMPHCTDQLSIFVNNLGKGQNYENQNIEIQKEHRKKFKGSEHRKCLFSSSLLQHQNIKKCLFSSSQHQNWLVDHYYKNQNVKKKWKEHFVSVLSDFLILTKLFYLWCKYVWHFGANK